MKFSLTPYRGSNRQGFIALMSVLILGAVGTAVAVSVLLLGLGASRTSLAVDQSNQAKAAANACAEQALEKLRESNSFTGTSLTLGQGTCTSSVTGSGSTRTITTSGTVAAVVRKVSISVSAFKPTLTVSSWQEVP